jgi:hypothetical protein
LASSVQIFFYIDPARHLAYLGAQKFSLCFISKKNLKIPRARARAPAYARAIKMGLAFKEKKNLNRGWPQFESLERETIAIPLHPTYRQHSNNVEEPLRARFL